MIRQLSVAPARHAQYTSCLLVYYFPNDSLCACFPYFIDRILWMLMFVFMTRALPPLPLHSFIVCSARVLADISSPVFSDSMQHFLESSVQLSLNFFFVSLPFEFGTLDHFTAKFSRSHYLMSFLNLYHVNKNCLFHWSSLYFGYVWEIIAVIITIPCN